MAVTLPESFCREMRNTCVKEADPFFAEYEKPAHSGIRLNTAKRPEPFPEELSHLSAVTWTEAGYYTDGKESFGGSVWHTAGAFYIQEPSAMAPAELLPVSPGNRVLDLCAAPGGKSTRLWERLCGEGVLVSNDISTSRAQALLRNLERFGAGNILVTAEDPGKLAQAFPVWFDAVLVDAPCSGEGMFRKDPSLIRSYEERGPEYYAPLQKSILKNALSMLRPGGYLLYSTCTFSPKEDEEVVEEGLLSFPDCEEVNLAGHPLLPPGIVFCRRGVKFMPHRVEGEGHYLALLHRRDESGETKEPAARKEYAARGGSPDHKGKPNSQAFSAFRDFAGAFLTKKDRIPEERLWEKDGRLYLLPDMEQPLPRLRYLRTGLYLGDVKNNRFKPAPAFAMFLSPDDAAAVCRFRAEDEAVKRYLKGETVSAGSAEVNGPEGICLVCADGLPLGFAKRRGDMLKNGLDPGWRVLSY